MKYTDLETVIDLMKKAYDSAKEAERHALDSLAAAEVYEEKLADAYGELLRLYDQDRNNTT